MKNLYLKYTRYAIFAILVAFMGVTNQAAAEPSRADLLAQLIVRLGPEKTAEFMARLEQKHAQEQKGPREIPALEIEKPIKTEIPAPVVAPTQPVEPAPVVDPIVEKPVKKPTGPATVSDQERHEFDFVTSKLENYALGIYKCVDAFFSKRNFEPYKSHVQCFKNQLQFLRDELLNQYPQPQTPEGGKLFKALEVIGQSLDKSQEAMCTTLENNFSTGMFAGTKLGLAMSGITKLIDGQRAIVDREIGVIRNLLRNAREQEMLKKINTLYSHLNKNFDYGNTKKYDELLSILNHRVKR